MARILIIDDSEFSRQRTVEILKGNGFDVLEAAGGREGLQKAEGNKPDCIILDLLMPEMNGYEVLNELKEKGITIPIVVLSADIQDTTQQECFKLGAVDFVKKPPKEEELLKAIQEALGSKCGG